MVRVVSQSFSHPRSRHSSGETDLDLAMRADSALSTLRAKRTEFPDYESSSDSFWDSELDTDLGYHNLYHKGSTEDELNGNETSEKSDIHSKRKERRRERNKVSAQAYRQRRRQVNVSTQQELDLLEERNKQLLKQVHDLEHKTEQAKQVLKGQQVSIPDFLYPKTNSGLFSAACSSNIPLEPQTPRSASSEQSLSSPSPSHTTSVNSNSQLWGLEKFGENSSQFPNFNANNPRISQINLNALGSSDTSLSVSDAVLSPSSVTETSQPSTKPKQSSFNANHCYKVPIHRHQVLRTVPEIPSNISSEVEEEYSTLSNHSHIHDSARIHSQQTKANCDELGNHNSNLNLNKNERMNSNHTPEKEKIWNGAYHMNPLKTVNMNDNENPVLSKSHVQNSPELLIHPKSFVHFIITAGENTMPSQ